VKSADGRSAIATDEMPPATSPFPRETPGIDVQLTDEHTALLSNHGISEDHINSILSEDEQIHLAVIQRHKKSNRRGRQFGQHSTQKNYGAVQKAPVAAAEADEDDEELDEVTYQQEYEELLAEKTAGVSWFQKVVVATNVGDNFSHEKP